MARYDVINLEERLNELSWITIYALEIVISALDICEQDS